MAVTPGKKSLALLRFYAKLVTYKRSKNTEVISSCVIKEVSIV